MLFSLSLWLATSALCLLCKCPFFSLCLLPSLSLPSFHPPGLSSSRHTDFDSEARTFNDLNFLAPARKSFRNQIKVFIDRLEAGGGTNYEAAFRRAFRMADTSYAQRYDSGCQTVYVFLSDGVATEGYKYVCMYVYTYVCMYVCMYIRMHVCMYVCMYVYTYVCMYICIHTHSHTHTHR